MSTVEPTAPRPSLGRIVHYTLTAADAAAITESRQKDPEFLHGNPVAEGHRYPMTIVHVWSSDPNDVGPDTAVQGQVALDGNDTLWVTSVTVGDGPGHYAWPARV